MAKYDALFEDENDIFGGTQISKFWDIFNQTDITVLKEEIDDIVTRIAVMERFLSETRDIEMLEKEIKSFVIQNFSEVEDMKKSTYMELAGKLVYRHSE